MLCTVNFLTSNYKLSKFLITTSFFENNIKYHHVVSYAWIIINCYMWIGAKTIFRNHSSNYLVSRLVPLLIGHVHPFSTLIQDGKFGWLIRTFLNAWN
jgi:hypothetical protein